MTQQPLFPLAPERAGTIYFDECGDAIKIGFTRHPDAARRIRQFITGSPQPHRLRGTMSGTKGREREIHALLAADRIPGDVGTEWFYARPHVLDVIDRLIAEANRKPWSPFLPPRPNDPPNSFRLNDPYTDPRQQDVPTHHRRREQDRHPSLQLPSELLFTAEGGSLMAREVAAYVARRFAVEGK